MATEIKRDIVIAITSTSDPRALDAIMVKLRKLQQMQKDLGKAPGGKAGGVFGRQAQDLKGVATASGKAGAAFQRQTKDLKGLKMAALRATAANRKLMDTWKAQKIKDQFRQIGTETKTISREGVSNWQAQMRSMDGMTKATFNTKTGVTKLTKAVKPLNAALVKTGDSLTHVIGKVGLWMIGTTVVLGTIRGIQKLAGTFVEVEQATAKFERVGRGFGETQKEIASGSRWLRDELMRMKVELGSVGMEAFEAATVFARLGMTQQEVARATRTALMAQNIAEISAGDAAKYLASAMKQFKLEASEIPAILDKANTLSNNYRVTTEDLFTSITRAGAVWRDAGGSMEELMAHTATAAQATSRSGREIGTAFKTIASRMHAAQHAMKAFRISGVRMRELDGSLRPINDALGDIIVSFQHLTAAQREDLSTVMAGIRRRNMLKIALDTYWQAQMAIIRQHEDVASASIENEIAMATLGKRAEQLTASLEGLGVEGFGAIAKPLKAIVDGLTAFTHSVSQGGVAAHAARAALTALVFIVTSLTIKALLAGVGISSLKRSIMQAFAAMGLYKTAAMQAAAANLALAGTATTAKTAVVGLGAAMSVGNWITIAVAGIAALVTLMSTFGSATEDATEAMERQRAEAEKGVNVAGARAKAWGVFGKSVSIASRLVRDLIKEEKAFDKKGIKPEERAKKSRELREKVAPELKEASKELFEELAAKSKDPALKAAAQEMVDLLTDIVDPSILLVDIETRMLGILNNQAYARKRQVASMKKALGEAQKSKAEAEGNVEALEELMALHHKRAELLRQMPKKPEALEAVAYARAAFAPEGVDLGGYGKSVSEKKWKDMAPDVRDWAKDVALMENEMHKLLKLLGSDLYTKALGGMRPLKPEELYGKIGDWKKHWEGVAKTARGAVYTFTADVQEAIKEGFIDPKELARYVISAFASASADARDLEWFSLDPKEMADSILDAIKQTLKKLRDKPEFAQALSGALDPAAPEKTKKAGQAALKEINILIDKWHTLNDLKRQATGEIEERATLREVEAGGIKDPRVRAAEMLVIQKQKVAELEKRQAELSQKTVQSENDKIILGEIYGNLKKAEVETTKRILNLKREEVREAIRLRDEMEQIAALEAKSAVSRKVSQHMKMQEALIEARYDDPVKKAEARKRLIESEMKRTERMLKKPRATVALGLEGQPREDPEKRARARENLKSYRNTLKEYREEFKGAQREIAEMEKKGMRESWIGREDEIKKHYQQEEKMLIEQRRKHMEVGATGKWEWGERAHAEKRREIDRKIEEAREKQALTRRTGEYKQKKEYAEFARGAVEEEADVVSRAEKELAKMPVGPGSERYAKAQKIRADLVDRQKRLEDERANAETAIALAKMERLKSIVALEMQITEERKQQLEQNAREIGQLSDVELAKARIMASSLAQTGGLSAAEFMSMGEETRSMMSRFFKGAVPDLQEALGPGFNLFGASGRDDIRKGRASTSRGLTQGELEDVKKALEKEGLSDMIPRLVEGTAGREWGEGMSPALSQGIEFNLTIDTQGFKVPVEEFGDTLIPAINKALREGFADLEERARNNIGIGTETAVV